MIKLVPSVACADCLNLEKDILEMERAKVDIYHIDIMDGHYVPNLCLNFDIVKQIKNITDTPIDVHLMVENPEEYIDLLAQLGVEYICFHNETTRFHIKLIQKIKSYGIKVGVALNPATKIDILTHYIDMVDYIHVMTVEPGFAGQTFIEEMYNKIEELSEWREKNNLEFAIEVDGGIDLDNGKECVKRGANYFVGGVFCIFNQEIGIYEACKQFKKELEGVEYVKSKAN